MTIEREVPQPPPADTRPRVERQALSPAHAHALSYTDLGIVVAPMWGGLKALHASRSRPERAILGSTFDLATVGSLDPAVLLEWWRRDPAAGVAVICGARSRLVVVDVDPRNGGDAQWEAWLGARAQEGRFLPDDLPVVGTPRGGYHLWVRLPSGYDVRAGTLNLPGVDIRGSEGWVGAPPSKVDGAGDYSWIRPGTLREVPWLLELLQPKRSGARTSNLPESDGPRVDLSRGLSGNVAPGEQHEYLVSVAASLRAQRTPASTALSVMRAMVMNFENGDPTRPWKPEHADEIWAWATQFPEGISGGEEQPLPTWRPVVIQGGAGGDAAGEIITIEVNEEIGNRASDLANAEDFTRLYRGRALWTPQLGWYLWNTNRWRLDEGVQVHARVTELARQLEARLISAQGDERPILSRRVQRLESVGGMKSCLEAAQHLLEVSAEELDAQPELLNMPNGTLNLITGKMHTANPQDHITHITGCEYDPSTPSPYLEGFWTTFLPEYTVRSALLEVLGSALIGGNRGRHLMLVCGRTTTGKSQLFEGIRGALGNYYGVGSPSLFRGSMSEQGRPELLQLLTKRIVVLEEAGGSWELHADRVKLLTGGVPLTVRALFSNRPITRMPEFTPVIISNEPVRIRGADDAIGRRMIAVEMSRRMDPALERPEVRALWAADEGVRRALLAEMIAGCFRVQARGGILMTGTGPGWDRLRDWTARAFAGVDDVSEFINEYIEEGRLAYDKERTARASVRASDLHRAYLRWVHERGDAVSKRDLLGMQQFARRLEAVGWSLIRSNGARWQGWALVGGGTGIDWTPPV